MSGVIPEALIIDDQPYDLLEIAPSRRRWDARPVPSQPGDGSAPKPHYLEAHAGFGVSHRHTGPRGPNGPAHHDYAQNVNTLHHGLLAPAPRITCIDLSSAGGAGAAFRPGGSTTSRLGGSTTAGLGGGVNTVTPWAITEFGNFLYVHAEAHTYVVDPAVGTRVETRFHGASALARSADVFDNAMVVALGSSVDAEVATDPRAADTDTVWAAASGVQMSVFRVGGSGRLFSARNNLVYNVLPGQNPATLANYLPTGGEVITDETDPVRSLEEFARGLVGGTARTARTFDPEAGFISRAILPRSRLSPSDYDGRGLLNAGDFLLYASARVVWMITADGRRQRAGPEVSDYNESPYIGGQPGVPDVAGEWVYWPFYFPDSGDSVIFAVRPREPEEPGIGPLVWSDLLWLENRECRVVRYWGGRNVSGLAQRVLALDNVAGYWRLGEAPGGAQDSSGNGNAGTVTLGAGTRDAAALEAAGGDGSIDFDGADTKVFIPADIAFEDIWDAGGSAFFMFNAKSDGETSFSRVFEKNADWQLRVQDEAGGLLRMYFEKAFTGVQGKWQTAVDIPIGTTIIGVFVYDADAAGNDPTLYLWDGTAFTTRSVGSGLTRVQAPTGTRRSDTGDDFFIGNDSSSGFTFDGRLDEIALFSDELTATEAETLINKAKGPPVKPRLFFGAATTSNKEQVGYIELGRGGGPDIFDSDAVPALTGVLYLPHDDFGLPGVVKDVERLELPLVEDADSNNYAVIEVSDDDGATWKKLVLAQSGSNQERVVSTGFQQVFADLTDLPSGTELTFRATFTQESGATAFLKLHGDPIAYLSERPAMTQQVTTLLHVQDRPGIEHVKEITDRLEALASGGKVQIKHQPGDETIYAKIHSVQGIEIEIETPSGAKEREIAVELTWREVATS